MRNSNRGRRGRRHGRNGLPARRSGRWLMTVAARHRHIGDQLIPFGQAVHNFGDATVGNAKAGADLLRYFFAGGIGGEFVEEAGCGTDIHADSTADAGAATATTTRAGATSTATAFSIGGLTRGKRDGRNFRLHRSCGRGRGRASLRLTIWSELCGSWRGVRCS